MIALLYKLICQHLTLGLSKTKSTFSHPSATIYESLERKQVLLDCTLLMAPQLKWLPKKKDLGITITKDLTWNNHLKVIVPKANRKMGFIKRNCFALLNTKTFILLYTSLVRSYFCYASQVWAPQSIIQDLTLVENTQRRATKFICKSDTFSYKDRLLRLRLLPLKLLAGVLRPSIFL